MNAVVTSIICRCIAYLSVLAFVFGLVWMSGNYNYLWFLLLLFTCEIVPIYESGVSNNGTDRQNPRLLP